MRREAEILLDQRTTITELLGIDGCDDTVTATGQSAPFHPDGQTTPQPTDHTGIIAWMAGVGVLDFPPGPVQVFAMSVAEDIPLANPGDFYQYGFAFDSDGEGANNRPSQPPYAYTFTDGTDLSYVAYYDPGYTASPWFLSIIDWTTGVMIDRSWSNARIIFRGNAVVLVVPSSGFAVASPSTRFFTWCHPGDWGYGGVWSADVEPPLALGLHTFGP